MLAARSVAKTTPADSARPATKKSPESRTRRVTHSPAPIRTTAYAASRMWVTVIP